MWNANDLHGILPDFESLLKDVKPKIVAVTEIKMNETSVITVIIYLQMPCLYEIVFLF